METLGAGLGGGRLEMPNKRTWPLSGGWEGAPMGSEAGGP